MMLKAFRWFPIFGNTAENLVCSFEESLSEDTPFWVERGTLVHYAGGDDVVTVPETVAQIGEEAFSCQCGIRRIIIHDNTRKIQRRVFSFCSGLESVRLPQSLTVLEDRLFEQCRSLQSVLIPKQVREIGSRAFGGCTQLRALSIPGSVRRIAPDAFADCPNLVLYLQAGTYAAAYARRHNLTCRIIAKRWSRCQNGSIKL